MNRAILKRAWLTGSAAACLGGLGLMTPAASAQPPCTFVGCCDVLSSNATPLPGQTVTVVVRGGVNPTGPCNWYGIGRMSGNIIGSASTNGIPAAAITTQQNIGFFGACSGPLGTVATTPLRILGQDCNRVCNFGGPGAIFGGCPLNNSAQDMYRFNFTIPAAAIAGTIYTFTYSGNVQGINTWNNAGFGWWCPVLSSNIAVGGCTATITVGGTPANNSCGNCTPLSNGSPVTGTTVSATTDGASSCGGTNDVWYCYTPLCPQPITVNTCGSPAATDTVLSVHTACPGLVANEVVCNDDALPGSACPGTLASSVTFTPTAGVTYYFRVATLGAAGPFSITLNQSIAAPPVNDPCTAATPVGNGTTPFSTCGATAVGPAACATIVHDIWYRYVPTCTGTVTISTCGSSFNTSMAVYTGPCTGLCQIACNDNNGPQCAGTSSSVSFFSAAGVPYLIRVGGNASGQFGSGLLTIGCTAGAPANDSCATVTNIGVGSYTGTTLGATPTPGLTGMCGASNTSPDVFYAFSTCNYGPVTITTCGTPPCVAGPYDTVLSVHNACPTNVNNQLVVCNDDACGLQSIVTFTPVPCKRYIIRLSGWANQSGNFVLNISQASTPPPNNSCASFINVSSGTTTPFSTCLATTDGGAALCGALANDIWYRWTAPCTGQAVVDTCGSSYDSVLSVYNSTACPPPPGSLVPGGCNDDSASNACGYLSSRVTINVVQGVTYTIRIGGYFGATGCGNLTITGPNVPAGTCPPAAGPFAPAQYYQVLGTSTGANWKWRLSQDCCFSYENCNVPGVPAGGSAAALAAAFVASLQAQCPSAIIVNQGGGMFSIKARKCAGNTMPIRLFVGTATDPCNALCAVTLVGNLGNTPTTGPCSFNPLLFELETSGLDIDCNANGVDDLVDIARESSNDSNNNSVPDECDGVLCDSIDFNADGVSPDSLDLDDFLSVFGGGGCSNDPKCGDIDFNNDGVAPDTGDVDALLSAFAGGPCP